MKKIAGWTIIASMFAAVFAICVAEHSFAAALTVFVGSAVVVCLLVFAVKWITDSDW